ncbi:PAS domain-containing sensor histidine kinase [Clostridium akagii]|uniref:sensor histidine kinase n=1 Tax=Clostridium akagii TaxID=91623 RepID=UPI0006903FD5|nr:PAS domain-containing sensor histidine kinase [Clostridium akagii]
MNQKINTDYDPYFETDMTGNITECNSKFTNLINYSKSDIIGKSLQALCSLLKINSPSFLNNTDSNKFYYIFTKHNNPIEVKISIKDFYDKKVFIFYDNHSSWLDDKFHFIEQIHTNDKSGIAIYNFSDFILLASNQRYLNFFPSPYNKKAYGIGRHPKDIITNFHGSALENIILNVTKTEKPFHSRQYKYIDDSSKESYWSISINPIQNGNKPKYILLIISNVTRQVERIKLIKQQSKTIHQQRRQLNVILENTSAGISIVDKLGNHTKFNNNIAHWYDLFEVPTDYPYINRNYYDENEVFISKSILPISYLLDKNRSCTKQIHIKEENNELYYLINWSPVFTRNDNFSMGIITTNDITCEIEKQKQLEKLMQMHEDFFSFIAHEFKTPITTISSTIQLLELVYKEQMTEKIRHGISTIKRNTYQQMRLVNNLLDITRAEAGYLKTYRKNYDIVNTTNVIIESINSFAASKNIAVIFKSDLDKKTIAIDDEKYERVLLNLLSNAIKFTPCNKHIYISLYSDNTNIYVDVKDEGPGIPQEKINIIFDRFGQVGSSYTRESEGTGIGLCLVKLLLKAMNGDIKLKSQEGIGSIFTIVLPINTIDTEEVVPTHDFTDDHLVKSLNIEFSNIYSC